MAQFQTTLGLLREFVQGRESTGSPEVDENNLGPSSMVAGEPMEEGREKVKTLHQTHKFPKKGASETDKDGNLECEA